MLKIKNCKESIKTFFITALTCVSGLCIGAGVAVSKSVTTSANGIPTINSTQKYPSQNILETFEMEAGAGIRLIEDGGMRFKVKMSESVKHYVVDNDVANKISLHFIITLKEYFNAVEDGNYRDIDKKILVDIPDDKIYYDETDGYWHANGCVYGVLNENILREYTAIAYYEDLSGETPVYEYAAHLGEDNVRSPYEVLNKAALDNEYNYYHDYLKNVEAYAWYGTSQAPILPEDSSQLSKLYDIINQGNTLEGKYYHKLDGLTTSNTIEVGKSLNATIESVVAVTFDTNGGNAVETQYVKKGDTATMPTAPQKDLFVFDGWEYNGAPYDFTKPVTEHITLTAVWKSKIEANQTSQIYYWTPVEETWIESEFNTEFAGKKALIKNTKSFSNALGGGSLGFGWKFDSQAIQRYIDDGYEKLQFQIYYSGTSPLELKVLGGDIVAVPANVWTTIYVNANELIQSYTYLMQAEYYNFTAGNITFALADIVPIKHYNVTYMLDSKEMSTLSIAAGGTAEKLELPGYDIAWKLNGEAFDFNTPITEDITLTASMADATIKEIGFTADSWLSIGDDQYRALGRDGDKWGLLNYTAYGQWQSFQTYWKFDLTIADVEVWMNAGYTHLAYTVTYNTNADAFVMFDGTSLAGAGTVNKTMTMAELKAYIENGTTNFVNCPWATAGQFYVSGMQLRGSTITLKEIGFTADSWFSIGDDQYRALERDGDKWGLLNYTAYGRWQSFQTYWKFDLTEADVDDYIEAGYVQLRYNITYSTNADAFVMFDGTSLAGAGTVEKTMELSDLKAYIANGTTNFAFCPWATAGQFYVSGMTMVKGRPTVEFQLDGEAVYSKQAGDSNTVEKYIPAGYSDIIWKLNGETFDFNTPITENITLTASVADATIKEIGFTADSWFSIGDDQYRALERDGDKWGLLNYTAYGQWQSFSTYWKFNLTVEDVEAWMNAGYTHLAYTVTYISTGNPFVLFDGTSLADAGTVNMTMTLAQLKAYIENGTTNFVNCGWGVAGQFYVSNMTITVKEIGFTADSWFSIGDDQYRALERDGDKWGLLNYTGYGQWQSFSTYWKFNLTVADIDAYIAAGYVGIEYTVTYNTNGNPFVMFDGTSLAGAGTVNKTMTMAELKAYIESGTTNFVNCPWATAGQFYVSDMKLIGETSTGLSVVNATINSNCAFGHSIQGDVDYSYLLDGKKTVALSVIADRFDVHKGAVIDVNFALNMSNADILQMRQEGYTHIEAQVYINAPMNVKFVDVAVHTDVNLTRVKANQWSTLYLTIDSFMASENSGYILRMIPTEYDFYTICIGNMQFVKQDIVQEDDSQYKILISDNASTTVALAANELQRYIFESTGVKLSIVKAKSQYSEKYISLGVTTATELYTLAADEAEVGYQGFYIKTINDLIAIYAVNDIGVLYGVYEYLGLELNYDYFYTDVYTLDTVDDLVLSNYDIVEKPDIDYRLAAAGFNYTNPELTRNLRLIKFEDLYINNISCWHNSLIWLPKDTYGSAHRNWYANSNAIVGTRNSNELCYTAHGNASDLASMQTTLADLMYEKLRTNGREEISFACMDVLEAVCTCSACRSAKNTYGSYSGALVLLMNAVAEKIEAKLLAAGDSRANTFKIVFLAYFEYEAPPTNGGISLNSHVVPMYAPIFMNFKKAITDSENQEYYTALKGWASLAEEVYVWLYDTQFVTGGYSMVYNSYQHYETLYPILQECKVTWAYFEGPMGNENASTAFTALKAYLQAKLGWDVDADYDALVDKFFAGMYGSQANEMKEIFNEINECLTNELSSNPIMPADWDKTKVENWLGRMNQIEATLLANGEDLAAKQVRLEKISQLYILMAGHRATINTDTLAEYKAELQALFVEFDIRFVDQGQSADAFIATF